MKPVIMIFLFVWIVSITSLLGGRNFQEESNQNNLVEQFLYLKENNMISKKKTKIIEMWFDQFVDGSDGLHYNQHLANRGNTMSNRRWLVGKAGDQKAHIKITSD